MDSKETGREAPEPTTVDPTIRPHPSRMRFFTSRTVLLAGMALLFAVPGGAQVSSPIPRDTARCGRAVVGARAIPPTSGSLIALNQLAGCDRGDYVRVVEPALLASRAITDTAELRSLWNHTRWVRDAALFGAALTVAENRSASPRARVYAFRALTMYRSTRVDAPSYAAMVQRPAVSRPGMGPCLLTRRVGGAPPVRRPTRGGGSGSWRSG